MLRDAPVSNYGPDDDSTATVTDVARARPRAAAAALDELATDQRAQEACPRIHTLENEVDSPAHGDRTVHVIGTVNLELQD